jgi:hypothetical protein
MHNVPSFRLKCSNKGGLELLAKFFSGIASSNNRNLILQYQHKYNNNIIFWDINRYLGIFHTVFSLLFLYASTEKITIGR